MRVAHVVGLVGELSTSNRNGNRWKHYEVYKIERLLDKKMVPCKVKGKNDPVDYPQFLVLWEGWPPESATWQWPAQRGVKDGIPLNLVVEYEAGLEAEAQLEAEEVAEDEDESDEEDEQ